MDGTRSLPQPLFTFCPCHPSSLFPGQVSPPQEHPVSLYNSWTERYQPVSYDLESRSGTKAQFVDMVRQCNEVGVRWVYYTTDYMNDSLSPTVLGFMWSHSKVSCIRQWAKITSVNTHPKSYLRAMLDPLHFLVMWKSLWVMFIGKKVQHLKSSKTLQWYMDANQRQTS